MTEIREETVREKDRGTWARIKKERKKERKTMIARRERERQKWEKRKDRYGNLSFVLKGTVVKIASGNLTKTTIPDHDPNLK